MEIAKEDLAVSHSPLREGSVIQSLNSSGSYAVSGELSDVNEKSNGDGVNFSVELCSRKLGHPARHKSGSETLESSVIHRIEAGASDSIDLSNVNENKAQEHSGVIISCRNAIGVDEHNTSEILNVVRNDSFVSEPTQEKCLSNTVEDVCKKVVDDERAIQLVSDQQLDNIDQSSAGAECNFNKEASSTFSDVNECNGKELPKISHNDKQLPIGEDDDKGVTFTDTNYCAADACHTDNDSQRDNDSYKEDGIQKEDSIRKDVDSQIGDCSKKEDDKERGDCSQTEDIQVKSREDDSLPEDITSREGGGLQEDGRLLEDGSLREDDSLREYDSQTEFVQFESKDKEDDDDYAADSIQNVQNISDGDGTNDKDPIGLLESDLTEKSMESPLCETEDMVSSAKEDGKYELLNQESEMKEVGDDSHEKKDSSAEENSKEAKNSKDNQSCETTSDSKPSHTLVDCKNSSPRNEDKDSKEFSEEPENNIKVEKGYAYSEMDVDPDPNEIDVDDTELEVKQLPVETVMDKSSESTITDESNGSIDAMDTYAESILTPKVVITEINSDSTKRKDSIDSENRSQPEPKSRPQRKAAKKAESQIKELADQDSNSSEGPNDAPNQYPVVKDNSLLMCYQCCRIRSCKFQVFVNGIWRNICQNDCFIAYKSINKIDNATYQEISDTPDLGPMDNSSSVRKCSQCHGLIRGEDKNLSWETMDYCNEECLGRYQKELGSHCANCKGIVQPTSLGKYCVRFGFDIKQFCCSTCLEEFKKGLKVCSYCQKDISCGFEGFLAPVGDKGQFKDFCSQECMEKYDIMSNNPAGPLVTHHCAVCNHEKAVIAEVILNNVTHKLCSEPCLAAFKFVNAIDAGKCDMCKRFYNKSGNENYFVYYDETRRNFCCKTCMNVYILANRKIVPCNWCKVKKYNFDMIKRVASSGEILMTCSLNCLSLYQLSLNSVGTRMKCDFCGQALAPQYHLNMSDGSMRNFCSHGCVSQFQSSFNKQTNLESTPRPTGGPRRAVTPKVPTRTNSMSSDAAPPLMSNGQVNSGPAKVTQPAKSGQNAGVQKSYKEIVYVMEPDQPERCNASVQIKPLTHTKGVSCRPHPCSKEIQTDVDDQPSKILVPIPVPIYVPYPVHMYSNILNVPVPFPLPIPVPMFIPTPRNSMKGIMKEIKRIQDKTPTDPFEAELLMMAEMVADDKKVDNTDSDSDCVNGESEAPEASGTASSASGTGFIPEAVDASNTFGEDMLQMALKMASELDEPAVDLETALTPSTISNAQQQTSIEQTDANESEDDPEPAGGPVSDQTSVSRGKKRSMKLNRPSIIPLKRGKKGCSNSEIPLLRPPETTHRIEHEKPDANMCLKYTFGVNAWRQWVLNKNSELEKATTNNRKLKLFKTEILQLTADELNYSLCLFVKEVRKPNGTEYAPDTIYYLCLGIQQYLFENGRIDNIFTDTYYEKFTECLDEVAKKFSSLYQDSQFIVTRVEEEHLWESKQLGAHSPHVLLSTLMFFNTKHFNLTTVEEHMQLSFSHIMKHWKRNPAQPGLSKVPGSPRNVLLRFYPPQSVLEKNSKKKKVYEQQENEANPLRCPVKLYEFYLSKCPESVKTRNDVFYLQPERSCVPDSPVWYSTMALGKEPLMKMLHRVKMVKEINIALLKS